MTGRRAKPKTARARNQPCAQHPSPTTSNRLCHPLDATQSHRREKNAATANEENENGKAENAAQRELRSELRRWQRKTKTSTKKSKIYRKVTKCYISSLANDGGRGRRRRWATTTRPGRDRTGQDRRAANRKTPFCSAACRLMRLQQMRRLPAVHHFCFIFSSLTHTYTHIDTDAYTKLSPVCVCGTHTATYPVAFDNSPQNVKNDEKLAPERSPSPHDVVFAYVLVMASVVLLFGGCHALLLSRSCTLSLSLSLSLCCASANIFASALRARCLVASLASSFFVFFFLVRPALVGCRIISSKVRISAARAHYHLGHMPQFVECGNTLCNQPAELCSK